LKRSQQIVGLHIETEGLLKCMLEDAKVP